MQLADLWRELNPVERQYTYYSPPHKTFSRKDYIFGTPETLNWIDNTAIHEIVISDHALITLTVRDQVEKRKIWRFPAYLANQEALQNYLQKEWLLYCNTNKTPDISPAIFWEAGKAFVRGHIILYTTYFKKEKEKEFWEASRQLREAQLRCQLLGDAESRRSWAATKSKFEVCQEIRGEIYRSIFPQVLEQGGQTPG